MEASLLLRFSEQVRQVPPEETGAVSKLEPICNPAHENSLLEPF